MAMGTNTDPYQPIEGKWRITRSVLEVLAETRHPVTITTKSDRVLSDLDILAPMAAQRLAGVADRRAGRIVVRDHEASHTLRLRHLREVGRREVGADHEPVEREPASHARIVPPFC
jgi:hypothetical protein